MSSCIQQTFHLEETSDWKGAMAPPPPPRTASAKNATTSVHSTSVTLLPHSKDYVLFGRPYYRSCLWHDVSSICLSVVCLSSVCDVLYCGETVRPSEKVSVGVNRKPGSKSSFFGSPPYFHFRFSHYGHRDGRFCLIFARTAQQSVLDGRN